MRFIILALACVFLRCQCAPHESPHDTHEEAHPETHDEKHPETHDETHHETHDEKHHDKHHGKYEGEVHDEGISDEDHYKHDAGHEHNTDYDHEAFLGKEDAHSYDEKTPDESKAKLGEIFHQVDGDGDGHVTVAEMTKWIHLKQDENIKSDTEIQMKEDDEDKDGHVSWDEYKKKAYGFLDDKGVPKANASQDEHHKFDPQLNTKEHYAHLITRDERRFKVADVDGNNKLSADEFGSFIHPETRDHMKAVVTKEALEDMDKNHDGQVTVEEYMEDYWPAEERAKDPTEPEWVATERKTFSETHDKNKDGKLDESEVKEYTFPSAEDHVTQEAKHLVTEADNDSNGYLTPDEMMDHHDIFIGSQATNFGDLLRDHEDL